MDENPDLHSDEIMAWPYATLDERTEGQAQLVEFAQRTYEAIREADRQTFQHDFLNVDLWCRLDISIIEIPCEDRLDYFVNEVEKFQSTCLWGRLNGPESPLEYLATESAVVLRRYLEQHYDPI
jgi:hypothetical protein